MSERRALGMGGAALVVSISILLSRVLGVVRETILAALLGVTAEGDVYRNAFLLPDLLNYLLAGGFLSITLIPLLARRFEAGELTEGWRDFSAVFKTVAVVIISLTALLWVLAAPLVDLLYPRLGASQVATVVELTRIALPAQTFFVLGALFMAVSYSQRRFLIPALAPIVYNLGIIAGGLIGAAFGEPSPHAFVWGAVIGALTGNFALQWLGAARCGLRWSSERSPAAVREYFTLAFPLMIGQSVAVLDEQFPRLFGQLAGEGGTAALSFARMLNMVPVGLIAQTAGVASYPFLARLAVRGEQEELGQTTMKAARAGMVAGMAATGLVVAVSQPAVTVVYQWGRFDANDAALVAGLLLIFSLSIPAWALHQVVARSFYANRRMWTPVVIGSIFTVIAIPVSIAFANRAGLTGIAWASTAVIWAYTITLCFWWLRTADSKLGGALFSGAVRALPAAALAALLGRAVVDRIGANDPLSALPALLGGGLVAAVTFVVVARLSGLSELRRQKTESTEG